MAKKKKSKGKKKNSFSLTFIFLAGVALIFMPTTILLFFGMLPTLVAALIDRSRKGTKALTVGAMNLAGCTPYLLELWVGHHTVDMALQLASNPGNIVMMYGAAAIGYMIDWMMAGVVTGIMVHNSTARIKEIEKSQKTLIERWGREVTGELVLDAYGFPVEAEAAAQDPAGKNAG